MCVATRNDIYTAYDTIITNIDTRKTSSMYNTHAPVTSSSYTHTTPPSITDFTIKTPRHRLIDIA